MSLRDLVFNALKGDAQIVNLVSPNGVLPNFAADSPATTLNRWIILRWGSTESALGRDTSARPVALTLAVYDREKDFGAIDRILQRSRVILRALEGQSHSGGWVICVEDPSAVDDAYDDGYGAVTRAEVYRIVASGL